MQPGLQTRFVTTVALLMLCMVTVLVAVTVQYQRRTLRDDLERRVEVLAELVASQPLIRQADPANSGLQDVADFLAEQPDIDFALLLTPDNEVLIDASGSSELVGQTVLDESGVVSAAVAGIEGDGAAEPAIREYEGAIHVAQPIVVDGQHVRTVDFAVSLNDVNAKSASLLIRGLLLGLGFLIIGVLATALLVRRITRPLTQLTEAAEDMSRVQIPALVEQLRSGEVSTSAPEVQLIEVRSDDEIGRLGAAFNSIQLTTAEVARSQGELLKRGISDIFVQLARRNQSLIDRQLEVIDDLEASERSPDALAGLFKLDHLAARMRRNAESLLVLADEGSTNVRARPVSMTDMVRVAIGEVEQYHRVEVLGLDDAMVKGAAASGMSHLLAELLDNALRNSPETSRVDVTGEANAAGYLIRVSDQGVGLSQQQLDEYNELLQSPPEMGLTLSRSLGFTVVSRLARQFDLRVSLTPSDAGGVSASVVIPAALLGGAPTAPALGDGAPVAPAPPTTPLPQPPPAAAEPSVASPDLDRPQVAAAPVPSLPSRDSASPSIGEPQPAGHGGSTDAVAPFNGDSQTPAPITDVELPPLEANPVPEIADAASAPLPTRASVAPPPAEALTDV
ncbi:MAG: HAMP domain-containing protein, partial [Acidimicrobiia bacterium]|nr:HAMP domain-containing protein [Acidimicrobiia bacterium]